MGATSMSVTVTYDGAILTPIGVTLGSVGNSNGGGRTLTITKPVLGTIIVTLTGSNQFQGTGALVNLNFNVIGLPGDVSPVNFVSFQYNEGPPCGIASNGRVTVTAGTVTGMVTYGNILTPPAPRYVPNVELSGAGILPVSTTTNGLGLYSLNGFGSGAYTVTPSKTGGVNDAISAFDSARVAQFVVDLIPFNATQLRVADVSGTGGITSFDATLISRYIVGLPPLGGDVTGTWIFEPASKNYPNVYANVANENYTALLMGEVSANWNDPVSIPGGRPANGGGPERSIAVKAADLVTPADSEVLVPVSIQGAVNKGIVSYEFDLRYDPSVLQPQSDPVDLADTVSRGLTSVVNAEVPGLLKVAVFGTTPIDENGVLMNLRFTAVGARGTVSPITWERMSFNEGSPRVNAVDGQVELSNAAPNQAEISGRLLTAIGHGVPNTRVTLTDSNGQTRSILSNGFGVYRFSGLQVGQTYTISVQGRRYVFTPLTVSVTGQLVSVDMIAEP